MADYMVINVLSSVCQKPQKMTLLNLARAKTPFSSSQNPFWLEPTPKLALKDDKVAAA